MRTNRLLLEQNRLTSHHRVTAALRRASDVAGIGNVTAHQLGRTVATQALNREMSLDVIAALLGQNPRHDNDLREPTATIIQDAYRRAVSATLSALDEEEPR